MSEVIKKKPVSTLFVDVKPDFISVDVKLEFISVDVKPEFIFDAVSLKFFCKVRVNVRPLAMVGKSLVLTFISFFGGGE